MAGQQYRPWRPVPPAPMVKPLVMPVWSDETRILGRLVYQDGRERYEPHIRPGGPAVAEEDDT